MDTYKAVIKVLVAIDDSVVYLPKVEEAFFLLQNDFSFPTSGEIRLEGTIVRKDFRNVPWDFYGSTGAKGVSHSWIRTDTAPIKDRYHCVMYVIDWANWQEPTVWGWNVGPFFNGMQTQLVSIRDNRTPLQIKKTMSMEIMHAWDQFADRIPISLESLFGVNDYDEDVIHGKDARYPVYEYRPVIAKLKDVFIKLFPNTMIQHIIEGTEQYLAGSNGKKFHIYNLATLQALKDLGIVSGEPTASDGSIPDSGKEIVVLIKE